MGTTICLAVREAPKPAARGTAMIFLVAAMTGGAITGGVASMAGFMVTALSPGQAELATLAFGASILAILNACGLSVWPAPSLSRQVSSMVISRHSLGRASGQWGLELGIGVSTRINGWALWALLAWLMLINSVVIGMMLGALYGGVRGAQIVVALQWPAVDIPRLTTQIRLVESRIALWVIFPTLAGLALALWMAD